MKEQDRCAGFSMQERGQTGVEWMARSRTSA